MNALLLKYMVESASGLAFYEYLRQRILIPCGMEETFVQVPKDRLQDCLNYNYEHHMTAGRAVLLDKGTPGLPHDPKARLMTEDGKDLAGHAGLFSTLQDMVSLAQGLLQGTILSLEMLNEMGRNRTGRYGKGSRYRQYLGYLCFSKSADQGLSEIPAFMGDRAIGLSGYTGNHFALDPELGVFDVFLGNRCHNRVAVIEPAQDAAHFHLSPEGAGQIPWPDGRLVQSSWRYVHQKDRLLHKPCYQHLKQEGWLAKAQAT
jgi:CubicO group peptidase (beta-lactamase class C family)